MKNKSLLFLSLFSMHIMRSSDVESLKKDLASKIKVATDFVKISKKKSNESIRRAGKSFVKKGFNWPKRRMKKAFKDREPELTALVNSSEDLKSIEALMNKIVESAQKVIAEQDDSKEKYKERIALLESRLEQRPQKRQSNCMNLINSRAIVTIGGLILFTASRGIM